MRAIVRHSQRHSKPRDATLRRGAAWNAAPHRIASHGHSIYAMAASLRWLLHSVSTRCAVQCSAVQCSAVQCSAVQCSAVTR
jgi:hypothetical protein